MSFVLDAILRSYGQVFFSRSRTSGALLMAATFIAPSVGLCGLMGAAGSLGLARLMGLDRGHTQEGLLGYNGLLMGLVLGATVQPGLALFGLMALGLGVLMVLQTALAGAMRLLLRLPALSLPFVAVTWIMLAAVPYVGGVRWRTEAAATLPLPAVPLLEPLSRLGAVVAVPHWAAGLLVLLAVAIWSRVALVHGALGLLCWALFDAALVDLPLGLDRQTLSFSFVFTPIALGGIFYVPSRSSLLVALLGSLGAGLLAVGLGAVGARMGLPLLSLPFNLAALVTVYALSMRAPGSQPASVLVPGTNPEETLRQNHIRMRRAPGGAALGLRLPFEGRWTCTQGKDGAITHQGPWRHGLDFEVLGPKDLKHEGAGDRVTDYRCYGRPVLAMAGGTVVQVVDGLPDNSSGQVDMAHRWGNLVLVQHGPALYSVLAHLQPHSIRVKPGEAVRMGQVLARCGASGRSPVPHLHIQLQASAIVGAPTLPLRFQALCRDAGEGLELVQGALPAEGETVAHPEPDAALDGLLGLAPGARLRLHCRADGQESTQLVASEVDLLGARALVDAETGARMGFDHGPGRFLALDYVGPCEGGLFALFLALHQLPLVAGPLAWTDHLTHQELRPSAFDPLLDLLGVLLPPRAVAIAFRAEDEGPERVVRGEAEGLRTLARLNAAQGSMQLSVELDGRRWEVECSLA